MAYGVNCRCVAIFVLFAAVILLQTVEKSEGVSYYNCYTYYTREERIGQKCADRWTGSLCDIPTCNPVCAQGMVCSDVDKCTCAATGATAAANAICSILPCSRQNNCYPGTCVNGACKCPPGFNGTNCERILQQPIIKTCGVTLTAKATADASPTQVAYASCASPGESPIVVWVNGPGLNIGHNDVAAQNNAFGLVSITATWTPSYVFPLSMPTRPAGAGQFFISNAPVAIYLKEATYTLTFPDSNNFTTPRQSCTWPSDATQYDCIVTTSWTSLNVNPQIGHGKTVIVNMAANLGGVKTGDSVYNYNGESYNFGTQQFTGVSITYTAAFRFDLIRPTHCLLVNASNPERCTGYPIQLGQDVRSDPAISPGITGWLDDGSGIARFSFQVFYMQPDASGKLSPNGNPLQNSEATLAASAVGNYRFTVPAEGTYSIIVTAYDHANNSARARKIFNYIKSPSYTVDASKPVYLQEADPNSNYTFITKLIDRTRVNLVWTGRFKPTDKWQTVFAARVNPLGASDGYTIDDVYGSQFGQRSLAAHDNQTGISSYTLRWYVDQQNGGVYAQPEWADNTTTKVVTTETATLDLPQPLTTGSAVVIWFTATGVTADNTTYRIVARVDTTPPNVTDQQFTINGGDSGYFSRFSLNMFDEYGGISSFNYTIVDTLKDNVIIKPVVVTPTSRRHPSKKKKRAIDQPCTPSDTSCYCTPFEMCYNYVQIIDIDNCDLDRYKARENFHLQLRYWVTNMAGLSTGMSYIDLNDISGITCRPNRDVLAIVLGTIFGFIGLLLLICLIIFLVIVVIRVRNHQSPIPNRKDMRTYAHNVRNRFSMRQADRSNENELYVANDISPGKSGVKQFNNNAFASNEHVEKKSADKFKISKKDVQFSDVLNEGRFAVIRRGFYMKANDKLPVAIKALKNGFSEKDEMLMDKKVAFMKTVPQHGNLVEFIGYIDENDGQGSIMVLELCDYPLTNWLEGLSSLSGDDLEQMLIFALNIAQGVQHLHKNKIIHRRLAARNVLVKQQVNGLVAKLIGFGPTAEDADNNSAGTGAGVAIPKKWLSPETLDTANSNNPTYNEKTDAWSYGVTIWEIYSKGAAPYQDVRSNDIHNLVKRGKRLQRPSDCPDELYNEVMQRCWADNPTKRPTFSVIQEWIQKFRSGNYEQQGEYYAAND